MQVSTKFTIAIHILAAASYFGKDYKITSEFLAGSIGCNPVIVRNLMKQLKEAGLISVRRGPGGVEVTRPLDQITFWDVYDAVETSKDQLFNFHDSPNPVPGGPEHPQSPGWETPGHPETVRTGPPPAQSGGSGRGPGQCHSKRIIKK